ncbi:site-2 protease family protein [Pleurocapsales cyanobacterium LEGE 06147]|nr:site-2 protease family protein [Pleurocapsales cyanobacterium LEGE 06147]
MQSFRLGSIFGFEIRVDLSWFIIFFLILWTLTAGLFPENYPGLSTATYIAMGVVGTLLFFASLVAHELSHSLVARAKGIPVEGITLFVFGGISKTRMDAESPGDEFQIAGIGPLVSLVLAALFGLIWWWGRTAEWTVAIIGVVRYLAAINLALAIFNLLPGFPLDGGRLFRSIVWKVTGSLKKATRVASWGGKLLSYLIIAFGVVQLFGGNLLGGLWLILIGWFLNNAAEMGYQQLLIQSSLEGVRARELMTPHPETVPPDLSLQTLVDEYFLRRRYQAFPVIQDDHPVGIITLNQVKETPREEWKVRTVENTMKPARDSVIVRPDEKMTQVLQKMEESGARRVLVTQNSHLVGIITANDVASWLRRRRDLEER